MSCQHRSKEHSVMTASTVTSFDSLTRTTTRRDTAPALADRHDLLNNPASNTWVERDRNRERLAGVVSGRAAPQSDRRGSTELAAVAIRPTDCLTVARAEALFVSYLSASAPLSKQGAADAITLAVRLHGGVRGCAAEVASAYGDHPETAAPRMRWARIAVESLFHSRRADSRR
jgi:hypothetical protein